MFKAVLRRQLKFIGIWVAVILVLFAARLMVRNVSKIAVTHSSTVSDAHAKLTNDQLQKMTGTGLHKVAENENLALSIDFNDGNIEVLDKQSQYTWRSRPTPEEIQKDGSNNLWKNNLQSPIMIEYIKDYTDSVPNYANVLSQDVKISVYKLDGGARVYFDFTKIGIKMACDYYLHNNNLEVDVPDYMMEEPADVYTTNSRGWKVLDSSKVYKIAGYEVLPFFGAVSGANNPQGYLMVPDGPGGLIRFDKNKKWNMGYTGAIYGPDYSYSDKIDHTLSSSMERTQVFYPVFGINRGDHAMLAVIRGGESTAEINAYPEGVKTSFYNAYAHFIYRNKFIRLTDLTGGGTSLYTNFSINTSRNIQYYFLHGQKSNYVGMAEAYRNHLIQQYGLEKKPKAQENLPLQLTILGGVEKDSFFGTSFISMTTFKQAGDIIDFFHQHHIRNMDIVYDGWAKHGLMVQYPNRFPADSRLGGMSELENFVSHAHRYGYKVLLADNHMAVKSAKGISLRKDTVHDIQNSPLDLGTDSQMMLLNPNAISRFLTNSLNQYKKLNVDGIEETGLDLLSSDFNKENPMTREEIQRSYRDTIAAIHKELGHVRLWRGSAFQLTPDTSIQDLADDYSFSPLIDETVPFYPISLHGLVDYVSNPYNSMDEPQKELLKAVEYGANISFEVTAEPTKRLEFTKSPAFSSEFNEWKDDILHLYDKVNSALNDVGNLYITAHVQIDTNVYITTYENGKEIICNYSDTPYNYDGKSIPPMDFIAVEGK